MTKKTKKKKEPIDPLACFYMLAGHIVGEETLKELAMDLEALTDRAMTVFDVVEAYGERAPALAYEEAAKIAEGVRNGYTTAITGDGPEPDGTTKFIQDIDGPWVLNSDVAKAIRAAIKK